MKMCFVYLLVFIIGYCFLQSVSAGINDDVILEKLDAIKSDIYELKTSFNSMVAKKDLEIKDLSKEIVDLRLSQTTVESKINIIWGIFGTLFGSGAVTTGVIVMRKRINVKGNGVTN